MDTGLCKFCGRNTELIEAHIVPKPFYTYFISDGDKKPLIIIDKSKPFESRCPKGFYDKSILCGDCDKRFGVYDQEAIKLFLSDLSPYEKRAGDDSIYIIPPNAYNYKKLKLFFISMLWRASVSSNSSFQHVKLGDKYEKLALAVLKNPELDNEKLFPVFIFKLKETPKYPIEGVFIDPTYYRLRNVRMYKFVFAGYSFNIKADKQELMPEFSKIALKSNSELVIVGKSPQEELSDMSVIFSMHNNLKITHMQQYGNKN